MQDLLHFPNNKSKLLNLDPIMTCIAFQGCIPLYIYVCEWYSFVMTIFITSMALEHCIPLWNLKKDLIICIIARAQILCLIFMEIYFCRKVAEVILSKRKQCFIVFFNFVKVCSRSLYTWISVGSMNKCSL